jgi:hypothetical protein
MSGERVPEALSREVQGMGRGPQGATTISEQNARLAAKAREIAPGYVLQGENVPAEPPRSFQLLAKPGTIPTAPAPAVVQPSTLETAAQMAKKITQPVSTFLNIPVVKGALHGANILGTGLQALEDIYHKDPLGLAITAGQAASGLLGPGGALIGIPLGEGVRYLRKHLSEQTPKQADLAQFGIEPLSKYGLQQMYEINMP